MWIFIFVHDRCTALLGESRRSQRQMCVTRLTTPPTATGHGHTTRTSLSLSLALSLYSRRVHRGERCSAHPYTVWLSRGGERNDQGLSEHGEQVCACTMALASGLTTRQHSFEHRAGTTAYPAHPGHCSYRRRSDTSLGLAQQWAGTSMVV